MYRKRIWIGTWKKNSCIYNPYIGHIHLKNYHYVSELVKPFVHVPLLNGDIAYDSLLKKIQDKCDCFLSLEPEVDFTQTIQSMRQLIQS